jgi:hypothetical protein
MGAAARLHADPAGRQGRRQGDESLPGHAATEQSPTLGILPDEMEHRLAEIDAECCYGHGYLLLQPSLQRKGSHQQRGRTIPLKPKPRLSPSAGAVVARSPMGFKILSEGKLLTNRRAV